MTPKEQVHFQILRAIEQNSGITQRDLARQLGISNGKINYLIAALVEKGLLKMAHFGRTGDKLAKVAYPCVTATSSPLPYAKSWKTLHLLPAWALQGGRRRWRCLTSDWCLIERSMFIASCVPSAETAKIYEDSARWM